MTEMRYELAIERIENIKGENTVSEKYRDYFRTLADFALLVDKLKEKIENGEYYKFSIEELECWNTHLYDDVLGEHYKTKLCQSGICNRKIRHRIRPAFEFSIYRTSWCDSICI